MFCRPNYLGRQKYLLQPRYDCFQVPLHEYPIKFKQLAIFGDQFPPVSSGAKL